VVVYPQYGIIHGEGLKYGIHGFSCLGRAADGGIMCYTNCTSYYIYRRLYNMHPINIIASAVYG